MATYVRERGRERQKGSAKADGRNLSLRTFTLFVPITSIYQIPHFLPAHFLSSLPILLTLHVM